MRVDDHAEPIAELRRLYAVSLQRFQPFVACLPGRHDPVGELDRARIEARVEAFHASARGPESCVEHRITHSFWRSPTMKHLSQKWLLAWSLSLAAAAASAQTLRVGLAEDPDVLDPTLARTFVGRIVFAALCDKLLEIDEKLAIQPQLATSWEWSADNKALTMKLRPGVTFHDGEKLDAAAVKFNLERHKNLPGSNRRGELAPLASVDVVDPMTVKLNLSAPFSPLLAALADRAGMMVSPKAAQAAGANFGAKPVCSGPFKFVERIAQDRIVLERYDGYWNKAQIHFDKVTYTPIVDSTVRLANLKSGQFDFIERVASSDIEKLQADKKFKVARITEIGYQGITINVGKSDQAQKNALGKDARVREAFELAIDRQGLAQVVMDNEATVGNQWVAPSNAYYAKNVPVPKRDVARAKALLKEAGVPNPAGHADDADHQRRAAPGAGGAGDDARGRLRRQGAGHRVRDLAQPGRQGRLRCLRAGLERPRRPRRQRVQLPRLQAAAQLRGLLQRRDRCAAQPVAHAARPGRAQEDLRADRRARAQGAADHLPVPPQLAVGLQRPSSAACAACPTGCCASPA